MVIKDLFVLGWFVINFDDDLVFVESFKLFFF